MNYQINQRNLYNFSIVFHYIQRLILYSSFYNLLPGKIPTLMHDLSIVCLLWKFILDAKSERFTIRWFATCILGLPFLFAAVNANANELVWILIFIVMAKEVDSYRLAKTIYIVCGIGTIIVVLSALSGIIPNNYELTVSPTGVFTVRSYMGFIHCNVFGFFNNNILMSFFSAVLHNKCVRLFVWCVPACNLFLCSIFENKCIYYVACLS